MVALALPLQVVLATCSIHTREESRDGTLRMFLAVGEPITAFQPDVKHLVGSAVVTPHIPREPHFGHHAEAVVLAKPTFHLHIGSQACIQQQVGLDGNPRTAHLNHRLDDDWFWLGLGFRLWFWLGFRFWFWLWNLFIIDSHVARITLIQKHVLLQILIYTATIQCPDALFTQTEV